MKPFSRKNILVLVALLTLFSFVVTAQPSPPEGKKWEVVSQLSDEFDTWNSSKWFKSLWNYGEPVQMRAENSGVSDGKLWIKATLDQGATRWFETSRVMSKTQITYPMYTECKMQTAHISAYNTFWLNNGNSENRDEIDVVESNSKPSCECQPDFPWQMNSQYFIVKNNDVERNKGNFDTRNLTEDNTLRGKKWNEDYHTVGVWWKDKNNIQFYLNGEPAGKVQSAWDFTRKLNIIWDLWTIDTSWSGGIADKDDLSNDSINTMHVDWIHTYSLVEDEPTKSNQLKFSEKIRIYPNPANNLLNIDFVDEMPQDTGCRIYDNTGQLVLNENLINHSNQIPLNDLIAGFYFIKIQSKNKFYTKSLIIQ